jgi:hypothetical protein
VIILNNNKNVLFLGNSYTYFNDLPNILSNLALSGGHNLFTDSITKGGAALSEFLTEGNELNNDLNEKLSRIKWDFIILQEQSQIPALTEIREKEMYPSVRLLNKKIKENGGRTVLYMTWGRHYGDIKNGFNNFESMQEALITGYETIAKETDALLVPVGEAWAQAKKLDNDIPLWDEDNSHPSLMGSYLAACVFYAALIKQSPVGLEYKADLSREDAEFLQRIAANCMRV